MAEALVTKFSLWARKGSFYNSTNRE